MSVKLRALRITRRALFNPTVVVDQFIIMEGEIIYKYFIVLTKKIDEFIDKIDITVF